MKCGRQLLNNSYLKLLVEQDKIFKELTGDDYNTFLQYAQICRKEDDVDGLGASVRKLSLIGYRNAAIIMIRAKDNTFWAAVGGGNDIHYYTNDKSAKGIPKTIASWREPDEYWKKTIK